MSIKKAAFVLILVDFYFIKIQQFLVFCRSTRNTFFATCRLWEQGQQEAIFFPERCFPRLLNSVSFQWALEWAHRLYLDFRGNVNDTFRIKWLVKHLEQLKSSREKWPFSVSLSAKITFLIEISNSYSLRLETKIFQDQYYSLGQQEIKD